MPLNERNAKNFFNDLRNSIKDSEGDEDNPYYDTVGKATIGYGFNIEIFKNLKIVCSAIYNDPGMSDLETRGLLSVINKASPKTNEVLNSNIEDYLEKIKNPQGARKFNKFNFSSIEQKDEAFIEFLEVFRGTLNKNLENSSISIQKSKIKQDSVGSKEYIVLMSLTYNNPSLIGAGLKSALKDKSRFRAWYEIRYNSNAGISKSIGIAKRRFKESNEFGLFEDDESNIKLINNQLSQINVKNISFEECIDVFTYLNIAKSPRTKDKTYLEDIKQYETENKFGNKTISGYMKTKQTLNSVYKNREYDKLFKIFAGKINDMLKGHTSKTFDFKNIYCVNSISDGTYNTSRINKALAKREENKEFKPDTKTDILIIYPFATAVPVKLEQPKNTHFTILLVQNAKLDCSDFNPDGKENSCELILTDYKKQKSTDKNNTSSDNEIVNFINPKTNSVLDMYMDEKDQYNTLDNKYSFDKDNAVVLNFFKNRKFNLLNFARENSYSLLSDTPSTMFDIKLKLFDKNISSLSTNPQSNFNLTLSNLIITDEEGKECDIDKVYLHSTEEKRVYESYSLVKNNIQDNNKDQEAIKNSYTAKFNINLNLDKNSNTFKKTVKLIIYSDNLTKEFTTKEIHKMQSTAIVSINLSNKEEKSYEFKNKVTLINVVGNITNIISSLDYHAKVDSDIKLKAKYKKEKDEEGYKEVNWSYKVIKSDKYDTALKAKDTKGAIRIDDKKGKEIVFNPAKDIKEKAILDKLKEKGHSIIFFAYLKSPSYDTKYGKTHIRVDFKIPLYLKYENNKLMIYEFEHTDENNTVHASLQDKRDFSLIPSFINTTIPTGTYYINSNLNADDAIDIYKDKELKENLHVRDTKNKQSLQNKYQIYLDNANNQTTPLSSTSNITAYYGINLIDTLNKSKFIKAFNEAKARVGLKDEEGVMLIVESESILFMSEQGRNFLKDIEICKLDPYDDQTGKVIKEWNIHATIGYGHLISEKEWSQYEKGITREQAGELFDNDLLKYEDAVVVSIKKYVTQNQFDALVIFCYNIGVNGFKNSSVVKIINGQKSNYSSLEDAWKAWGKSNGKQNKGLENRRNAEYKIYSEGKYERW